MWQKELEKIQCESLVKGQQLSGMPASKTNLIINKMQDNVIKIADIEAVIRGLLAKVQLERREIIEYINNIDDSAMRQIVFLRNVSCMSWDRISRELGGNNTEDSVRMKYNRFLKENKNCSICSVNM